MSYSITENNKKQNDERKTKIKECGVFENVWCCRVIRVVRDNPGITYDQIAKKLGIRKESLSTFLKTLIETDIIQSSKKDLSGTFTISAFGTKTIKNIV